MCILYKVGVSDDESIFVLAGFSRNKPEVCASLKPQEVKKCKVSIYMHYVTRFNIKYGFRGHALNHEWFLTCSLYFQEQLD